MRGLCNFAGLGRMRCIEVFFAKGYRSAQFTLSPNFSPQNDWRVGFSLEVRHSVQHVRGAYQNRASPRLPTVWRARRAQEQAAAA